MPISYKIIINVSLCILIVLLSTAVYIAWASIQDNPSTLGLSKFITSTVGIPPLLIFIGTIHAVLVRNIKVFAAWFLAMMASAIAVFVFLSFVLDCDVTLAILEKMKQRLSAKELASAKPDGKICPKSFYYIDREGKEVNVFGFSDLFFGPEVYFDNDDRGG